MRLFRLNKSEDFEHFIKRPEAPGENDQSFCGIYEPELAHEEVVELKCQLLRHIRIDPLFQRRLIEKPIDCPRLREHRDWPLP